MEKKISRQRRWQIKQVKQGLCYICGLGIYKSDLCFDHYIYHALRQREYSRKKFGWNPWKMGGQGKPPTLELRKPFLP
jgi:hypothetical protein